MANTLANGLSSALGLLVALLIKTEVHLRTKAIVLFAGIIALLVGVGASNCAEITFAK